MKRLVLLAALCLCCFLLAALALAFSRSAGGAASRPAVAGSDGAIIFVSARLDRLGDGERYAISADGSDVKRLRDDHWGPRVWSPDATKFAYASDGLPVADADGGNERLLIEDVPLVFLSPLTWSADGSRIAYSAGVPPKPRIHVVALAGGQPESIADGANPAWSPSGESIAFIREEAEGWALFLMAPDGTGERRLWPPSSMPATATVGEAQPKWSSDGRQLAYMTYEGQLAAIAADGSRPRLLARDVRDGFEWSPTSPLVAFTTDAGRAFIVNTENGRLTRLAASLGKVESPPSWSPDGTRLVLSIGGDLWVVTPANRRHRRLLNAKVFGAWARYPQWEAGSRRIADLAGRPVAKNLSVRVKADVQRQILRTDGVVEDMSADGGQVALRVGTDCPHVEIWERERGTVARFPVTYDCSSSNGAGIGQVALSGGRAAWIQFQVSNHLYLDVVTATAQRPFQEVVFSATDEDAGHLLAANGLFVFANWRSAGAVGPRTTTTLWGFRGARASRLRSDRGAFPMALDRDRIVVPRGGGRFEILDVNGRRLGSVKLHEDVRALTFEGHGFVALRGTRLEWLTESGTVRHSWPTSEGDARLEGIAKGIVVYAAGHRVHVLRLRDGRRVTVSPPGQGTVHASLDEAGLFYSYEAGWPVPSGRVAFMALEEIERRLG
jgi:Tol biopolymer transport system component